MINAEGLALLQEFEGFAKQDSNDPDLAHAYWDDIGKVWTIGHGFTRDVKEGDTITRAQDAARLRAELIPIERQILSACDVPPNENELSAMLSMAWNVGTAGFLGSTVLKAHNRGDHQAASRAFGLWNKSNGKVINGLTRRRAAEAALYLKPVYGSQAMPQRVDPESSLTKSPIVNATTAGAASATLAVVAESVKSVKEILGAVGDWLPYVATAAVVILAVYVILQRKRQRTEGWA